MQEWITTLVALCLGFCLSATAVLANCEANDLRPSLTDEERARIEAALARSPFPVGRYFAVEKDGARSLIFGTDHSLADRTAIPDSLFAAVETARVAIFEVTRAQEVAFERDIPRVFRTFLNPKGPYLRPEFTLEEWTIITAKVAAQDVPRILHNQLKPIYVMLALSVPDCDQGGQFGLVSDTSEGLDWILEDHARLHGVPVTGLETIGEATRQIDEIPFQTAIDLVRAALATEPVSRDTTATLDALYREGASYEGWLLTLEVGARYFDRERLMTAFDAFWQALLVERNTLWMPELVRELERGNAVVAVGALHLPSEDGLLAMLEAEGFEISPMEDPWIGQVRAPSTKQIRQKN